MSELASSPLNPSLPPDAADEPAYRWFNPRTKTALGISSALCFGIQWFLGGIAGVPEHRGFQASLLSQPSAIVALLVVTIGLVGCALLLNLVNGFGEPEDALFGAAAGLAAYSCRGGPMTALLQYAAGPGVFITLTIELILLAAIVAGTYWILQRQNKLADLILTDDVDWNARLMAAATTTIIMAIALMIFAQTDAKKQAMASVGVSAFIGAAVAFSIFDLTWAPAFIAAPFAVGIVGYIWAYFSPGAWPIGQTGQPLAYPLPLDYASVGVIGSLLGVWSAQKWKEEANG